MPEDVTVYAATAHNSLSADDKVSDYIMTLTPVAVTDSLKGYVVYGPAGDHSFSPTSLTSDKPTILEGNATDAPLSALNIHCYVLADKSWGIGFYRFTGSYLADHRAWLPYSVVTNNVNESLSNNARAIRFEIAPTTGISSVHYNTPLPDGIYTIDGKRVDCMTQQGVYVVRKNGRSEKIVKN